MILRFAVLLFLCLTPAALLRAADEKQPVAPPQAAETQAAALPAEAAVPAKQEEPAKVQEPSPAPAAPAPAGEQKDEVGTNAAEPAKEPVISPTEKEEIASMIRYALSCTDQGRLDMALIAFNQLMRKHLTRSQERTVLLGFARALRKNGDLTKACALYEKVIKDYSLGDDVPEIYLELGRTLRAIGAYRSALARFYSVINSTIKLPEDGAQRYRQLAKTAQFEIAETHFLAGNFVEASRFYSRLQLLDLAQADRAKAHFKSAYALFLAQDFLGAIRSLRSYIEQNLDDENVPEAHYYLAVSYLRLNRPMEALVESLELLRSEKTRTSKDPKRWAYWQRKTGNQIANEFYEQGDFNNALAIYQTLAELSPELNWRLPIVYQSALCQERLGQMDQAVASYQSILDKLASGKGDANAMADVADLGRMASWRLSQISWQHKTEQHLNQLMPQRDPKPPTPAPNHDASGNPATTPSPLR